MLQTVGVILTPPPNLTQTPKKPTQIRVNLLNIFSNVVLRFLSVSVDRNHRNQKSYVIYSFK